MRDRQRVYDAIGLAMKAGRLKSGDFAVEKLLRAGKARLLIVDETASARTKERYESLCKRQGVDRMEIPSLGKRIGRPGRMLAAVIDENFAAMIRRATERAESDE